MQDELMYNENKKNNTNDDNNANDNDIVIIIIIMLNPSFRWCVRWSRWCKINWCACLLVSLALCGTVSHWFIYYIIYVTASSTLFFNLLQILLYSDEHAQSRRHGFHWFWSELNRRHVEPGRSLCADGGFAWATHQGMLQCCYSVFTVLLQCCCQWCSTFVTLLLHYCYTPIQPHTNCKRLNPLILTHIFTLLTIFTL
jgi:hypothetical protein